MLAAAERCFAERGFDAVSVRRVAAEADVPVGSIYRYFPTKEAVLDAVVDRLEVEVDRVFLEMDAAKAGEGRPAELGDVVGFVIGELTELATQRPIFRTLFAGPSAGEGVDALAGERLRDRVRGHVVRVLDQHEPRRSVNRRAGLVCTEIVRGLLPRVVGPDGRIDRSLRTELVRAVSSYLAAVKAG